MDNNRIKKLHKESLIVDGLGYSSSAKFMEEFVDDLLDVGVAAVNLTIVSPDDGLMEAIKKVEKWNRLIDERRDGKFILVKTSLDIEKAKREGKLGLILGSQNGTIIEDDLIFLGIYKRLGMRIIQPTYSWQNLIGEGCAERTDGGLSTFGLKVVEEMNRLGLVIDLSHCAPQVTMDAIKYSKSPVLITHSNPRALCDHDRNKTDKQIKALAKNGGVIGICTYMPLLTKDTRPTWTDFLNCIDYVVKLVGVDYVGIGTDFSLWTKEEYEVWLRVNPNLLPAGPQHGWLWRNIFVNDQGSVEYNQVFQITEGLIARGYSDQDIKKILGLNFLRVFKEVCG